MEDIQVRGVYACVRRYLQEPNGRTFDVGNARQVEELMEYVQENPTFTDTATDELRTVIAMCLLGPQECGIPPAALREEVLAALREFVLAEPKRSERVMEVVIAYGCGAWREVQEGGEGWEHRWQPALARLTQYLWGWMRATAAWLHFEVQLKGYAFRVPFPSKMEALGLAGLLWSGKCDCWQLRSSDGGSPPDRQASLRAARCLREHRLSAWNPAQAGLADFLANAVKGRKARGDRSSRKGFLSGGVAQGMFFGELYRECEVRFGNVLGWECPSHPKGIFEGRECLVCDEDGHPTLFHETRHRRKVVKRLLVRAPAGPYAQEAYWHCQAKDTYYQEHHTVCPLGGHARTAGAAKSSVWVFGSLPRAGETETGESGVWEALQQLDASEQEVVRMIVVEGMSEKQAAQELGMPRAALQGLFENALTKLRHTLAQES